MKTHITNTISKLFGRFASYEFPSFLQTLINKGYVNLLGLDMSEFEQPSSYKSLNAFFTRSLLKPREFCKDKYTFISPSDSLISAQGHIVDGLALQIKGFTYSVKELLDLQRVDGGVDGGIFMNFYLSPKDYHRYHAPLDLKVLKAKHISKKLYPVNFTYLKKVEGLFCQNERVILECENELYGKFYLVFVGALNVGKMEFNFDKNICTNAQFGAKKTYKYENVEFKKGDELGYFKMGSTIVAIFENKNIKLLRKNEKVKFGDSIAVL